jgi:hypothetical protein
MFSLIQRFEMTTFWDIAPSSFVEVDWRFRDPYCFHRPDDGGSTHTWNACKLLRFYTTSIILILAAVRTWNLAYNALFILRICSIADLRFISLFVFISRSHRSVANQRLEMSHFFDRSVKNFAYFRMLHTCIFCFVSVTFFPTLSICRSIDLLQTTSS